MEQLSEIMRPFISKAIATNVETVAINKILHFIIEDKINLLEVILQASNKENFNMSLAKMIIGLKQDLITIKV